jgi:glycosyltransferase involved in cell wall biosynthesis
MKIGILGTRGIPNAYGGFEQFAQHLSLGLMKKGHKVFVYNSTLHPYKENQWQGINIIHCKDWEDKIEAAGQFIYDLNCINDARKRNYDILLQLGYTSNSIWFWRWPKNSTNIVNMDGLEWKRTQYSKLTRKFLRKAEALAAKHADSLIADSPAIQQHVLEMYNRRSTYIPYAADVFNDPDISALEKFKFLPQEYYLLIARMEPENNIEMIVDGYLDSTQDHFLVVVGSIKNKFGKHWSKKYGSNKIIFLDAIYDKNLLNNLRFFSKLYFHGHSVGGTNPSLLEAMACSCNIAAHNNSFNRAILNDSANYFSTAGDITKLLSSSIDPSIIHERKETNLQKIKNVYTWNNVIDSYEKLFMDTLKSQT